MSFEIVIADAVEKMLEERVFHQAKYIVRRDGRLIPLDRGKERHEQHLYFNTEQTLTARDIEHVDSIVLNSEKPKTVEMILEYEYNSNPKNMVGNFLAPFMATHHIAKYENDNNTYLMDSRRTLVFLLICFKEKHPLGNRGQAPIQKGENAKSWLLSAKELLKLNSNILEGDILISENPDELVEELYLSISRLRPDLVSKK